MIKLGGIVDLKVMVGGVTTPINEGTRSQVGIIDRSGKIIEHMYTLMDTHLI